MERFRHLAVPVGVIAVLVAGILFNMNVLKQQERQEALTSEVVGVQRLLSDVNARADTMEQKLAEEPDPIADEMSEPSNLNPAAVIHAILDLAKESQVNVPEIGDPVEEKAGENSYPRLCFKLRVEGNITQLFEFTTKLEGQLFPTLVLENLSLSETPEVEDSFNLSITFSIYEFPDSSSTEGPEGIAS